MADNDTRTRSPFSLLAVATALVTVALVVAVVLFAAYHTCAFAGCPQIDQVRGFMPDEASVVLDRDGDEIGKLYRVNRVVVELDELPEHVPQAFIATEDQEFYDHSGVDWIRALGALWQNVRSAEIAEGFSTITMQVARNVFPEQLPVIERTLERKISEIKVARQLEGRYTKDEILALYLNQIYFGSGAWGIEAAGQEYFGKPASELGIGEAALLAGVIQAPSELNPRENMEGALERRRTVLDRMVGEGFITEEQAVDARDSDPDLTPSQVEAPERAAYFVEHVRRLLQARLGDDIYTQGYTVHTTLDLQAQEVARRELLEQLRAIETGRYGPFPHPTFEAANGAENGRTTPYLQGAVVVMAAESGDVLALVGGRDFAASKFNRAIQSERQPGSAFKPFVYATAIQGGYPPTAVLQDTPYHVVRDGREWSPENYGGSYAGEIMMREALAQSKNVATVRLAEQVGLSRVIQTARSLGIDGDLPPYPSLAIGAAEVSLLEMVAAYGTFATLGDRPDPRFIVRVTDRHGNLVWRVPPRSRHALESDVAFLTLDLMRDVVDRGTGTAVRAAGFAAPAAGKTGTTNESSDVWFVGFTPEIVTGVWIGMDDPQRIMARATGGRLAAPVWGRIMRRVGHSGRDWSPPPGIEQYMVDARGNAVASNCPTTGELRTEYFLRGTVAARDCREYLLGYGDTAYADSLYDDDAWWSRLRERLFGEDESRRTREDSIRDRDTVPPDTSRLRPVPPDTTPRPRPTDTIPRDTTDTIPRDTTDTIPRDTTDTIPRDTTDTIPRDTTDTIPGRPARDTTDTVPPPPDTSGQNRVGGPR
ncbi:MAG: transglycosylase domain-containing protein [Gemmatimonadota bacterium]